MRKRRDARMGGEERPKRRSTCGGVERVSAGAFWKDLAKPSYAPC